MNTLMHCLEDIGGQDIKISIDIFSLGTSPFVFSYMGDTFLIQPLPTNYFSLDSLVIVNFGWMFVDKREKILVMEVINDVNKQPGYFPKIVFFEDDGKNMYGLSSNATVVFNPNMPNAKIYLKDLLHDFFGTQQLFKLSYAMMKKK